MYTRLPYCNMYGLIRLKEQSIGFIKNSKQKQLLVRIYIGKGTLKQTTKINCDFLFSRCVPQLIFV